MKATDLINTPINNSSQQLDERLLQLNQTNFLDLQSGTAYINNKQCEVHQEKTIQIVKQSPRKLQSTNLIQGCVAYVENTNNQHCQQCAPGFVLFLRDAYNTLCAQPLYSPSSGFCQLPLDQNPANNWTQPYFVDKLITKIPGFENFCYNDWIYFKQYLNATATCQDFEITKLSTYYPGFIKTCSACLVQGYDSELIVDYPSLGFSLRACEQTTQCGQYQVYDPTLEKCVNCEDLFPNCATCDLNQCTSCQNGFYLNQNFQNTNTTICVVDTCQIGYCKDLTNQICRPSIITGCVMCSQPANLNTQQTCQLCANGKNYNSITQKCDSIPQQAYPTNLTYYVVGDQSIISQNGQGPDTAFIFLQQAINQMIRQTSQSKVSYNVTIYIGNGNTDNSVFFFYCNSEYEEIYSLNAAQDLNQYCGFSQNPLNYLGYQTNDNVNLTIMPLYCTLQQSLITAQTSAASAAAFNQYCIKQIGSIDYRPLIIVNDAYANFNITGKVRLIDLRFTGINQMAVPVKKSLYFQAIPMQLCDIAKVPNGFDGNLALTSLNPNFPFNYSCIDSYYSGPSNITFNSSAQCTANQGQQFSSKIESTLNCLGRLTDPNFFLIDVSGTYYYRRRTLFNIYSFPLYQTVSNKTPELHINNCDFQYFLNNYESLIYVETDTFWRITQQMSSLSSQSSGQNSIYYFSAGTDRGAKINITSSTFQNSRFCKGLIAYRGSYMVPTMKILVNYTRIFVSSQIKQDAGAYIILSNSNFQNLNIFTSVSALANFEGVNPMYQVSSSSDSFSLPTFIHKGIVLNIEDFGGRVEVSGSTFTKNMHFIPAVLQQIQDQQAFNNEAQFLDAKQTLEYKMIICSTINLKDLFFFNNGYFYGDNVESFFDSFERLGVIYISRNRDAMIFRNNRFQQNIGTFGGAITINSPDWTRGQNPSIIISGNWFQQNMAYFSGNAVYIRSTLKKTDTPNLICGGVRITENNFLNNIGMKIHNGGAVSALCNYIVDQNYDDYLGNSGQQKNTSRSSLISLNMISQQTLFLVDTHQVYIALNNFQENYSGMKGTALQIIQFSNVTIDNCQFNSNGPVYASLEMLYSPYSLFFAQSGAISFRDKFCSDEFKYLDTCKTSDDQQIYWSRVQGALYVAFCQQDYCKSYVGNHTQTLQLTNSQFINNDVGPIFDDTLYDNVNDPTASQIFISGGNNTIQNCLFQGNFQPVSKYFPSFNITTKLQKFFPDQYFNSSTSSMIVITLNSQIKQNFTIYNTTISQCNFLQNKNQQIFGFSSAIYYPGSLIRYINLQTSTMKYLPLIQIQDSNFIENQFKGPASSLISIQNSLLYLQRCNFQNNGFLSSQIFIGNKTKANVSSPSFTFQSNPNYNLWQEQGMISLLGTTQFSNASYIHEIINNTFNYIFSSKGAAMTLNINSQDALLQGNKYSYLFSDQGGQIINIQSTSTRSTIMMINETIRHVYSLNYAAISMFPQNPVLSLLIYNSTFFNIYGKQNLAIYASAIAKLLVDNTNFTQENFQGSKVLMNRISSNFKFYQTLSLQNFIDSGYLRQFVAQESVSQSGMIYIEMTTNNQDLQFGGNVLQSLANYSNTQYSEITNCLFYNIVAQQYSAISILQSMLRVYNNPTLNMQNQSVGIFNNIVTIQGVIGISTGSTFFGVNLAIKNNSASMASGIFATSSVLNLQNVRFLNNTCLGSGTLTIQAETSLLCQQCQFIGNQANDSSTIFAFSNKNSTVRVENSAFTSNIAFTNLMTMLYSVGSFTNVTFFDNLAQNVNNGLTLISSNFSLNNVTVNYTDPVYLSQSSYRVDSGFLNLNYQSYLTVSNSNFQNCRGAVSSLAYVSGASTIFINSGTIIQNGVAQSGQTIFGSMAQLIQIDRSIFLKNSLKNVYLEQTIGIITNSYFSGSQSSEITLYQASATIINNTFVNGQNFQINGKGINCVGNNLTLINNTFRNLSAVLGGALYLESTNILGTSFYIYNNIFQGNKAQQGGAIYIANALLLQILTNLFNMNQALVISPSTTQSQALPKKGLGGAIYYACQSTEGINTNCTVNLFQKNMFLNNVAANDGGALIYVNAAYKTDNSNIFSNNSAFYGNDSASYASQISMQFLNNGDYLNPYNSNASPPNNSKNSLRLLQSQSLGSMPNIVSGTPFSFNIYILDQNGGVYTTDNISKASLKPADDSDLVIVNGDVIAQNGVFQFSNVIVTTKPGSQINVRIEISGTQSYGNPVSFLESPMQFSTIVRNCTNGESYESDGSCKVCAAGTFLYEPPQAETFCQPCNQYAICYGGPVVAPIPGYWRSSNVSNSFIECLQPALCLGGNQTEPVGVCTKGNTGILCAECSFNYKRGSQYQCTECPSNKINTIQIILIGIVAIFVVVFLVRSTLQGATKQKPVYAVYLKILTNHFQMIGAIQFIDFHWPDQIQKYQQGQQQVPQTTSNALSFDCFIMANQDQKTQDENIPVFYFKIIIFGLLPVLLALMDLIFWSGAYQASVIKEKLGNKPQDQKEIQIPQTETEKTIPTTTDDGLNENDISYKSKFISTLVVLLFLVQPNIAQIMFMAFDCTQVDNEFRLKQYTKSVCYQGDHLRYIIILVGPSVVLWAFGIPLFSSLLLKLEYKTIQVMKEKVITEQQKKDILILKQKYGFLFAGYQPRTLYWETIIMLRKTCMIMATVFFSTFSAEIQVLTVLLIIIVSWFLQIFFEPYYTDTLNRMENYSLQVAAVTLYSGMYYVTGIHYSYMSSDFVGWLFLFIILAPNIAFFTFWGLQMRIEILKMLYAMNKPKLFKIVAFMEPEVFWEKYMKQQEEDEVRDAQIIIKEESQREKETNKLAEKRDAIIETDAIQIEFNHMESEQIPQSKRIKRKIQRREERYRVHDDQINSLGDSEYHIGTPKGKGIQYLQSDITNFEDGPVNTNPRDYQNTSIYSKIFPETARLRHESESRRHGGSAHHKMQNYAQYFFNQRSPGGQLAKYIQSISEDSSNKQNESGNNNTSHLRRKEKRERKLGLINTPIEEIISTDRGDQASNAEPIVEQIDIDNNHDREENENVNNFDSHRPLRSELRVDTLLEQLQTLEANHCDKTILRNSFENSISQYSYKESKSGGSSLDFDNINPKRVGKSPQKRSFEKESPHIKYTHGKKDFKSAIKKETQNQSASIDDEVD